MELLVYNKIGWMDQLTPTEIENLSEKELIKYNARNQRGDIIELRQDGYFALHDFNRIAFCVIKLPNIIIPTNCIVSLFDGALISKKRRFKCDMDSISFVDGLYTGNSIDLIDKFNDSIIQIKGI